MSNRDHLKDIKNLDATGLIAGMDDTQFEEYVAKLNLFIDNYPTQEEKVREALPEMEIGPLSKGIEGLCNMLRGIHAQDLADECTILSGIIVDAEPEEAEADIVKVLGEISTLSIDIQMALATSIHVKKDSKEAEVTADADEPVVFIKKENDQINILAVDDTAFFLSYLNSILSSTGYNLTCVNSGDAALNYIVTKRPDLFILDIDMPGMDGYELADRIRAKKHTAPIIFLTANATRENVIKAMKLGAADFILKPINKDEAIARISKHV
jgi:CheY-like chemotaxis protein